MNNIEKLRKIIEKSRFCIVDTGNSILYIDPKNHSMSTMSLQFFKEFGNIKGNGVLSLKMTTEEAYKLFSKFSKEDN